MAALPDIFLDDVRKGGFAAETRIE